MTLSAFRDLLLDLAPDGVTVYHQHAPQEAENPMIVWLEGRLQHLWADDEIAASVLPVQCNYYTSTEYDPGPYVLLQRLIENGVSCEMEPGYDADLGEWFYLISCEVAFSWPD